MRASAMMHLPALVISGQMEKVVRAVNQLGMVVRGLFGEGSDASGSIFQISNQTTLGEAEEDILKRLQSVLQSIVEHELNARAKLLEADGAKLFDKIGRAFGILQNSHLLSSGEAMNLLSLLRLGVDLGLFADEARTKIDRLFIEAQPGHVQHAAGRPEVLAIIGFRVVNGDVDHGSVRVEALHGIRQVDAAAAARFCCRFRTRFARAFFGLPVSAIYATVRPSPVGEKCGF